MRLWQQFWAVAKAMAVVSVQERSHANAVGIEPGMVLTSVNGARVADASLGKKMAVGAGVPVRLGFDEPEPKKQLSRRQCREMVRIQLEIEERDPNVSDQWIDDIFDEFDADGSGFVDDEEWDRIVLNLASRPYPGPEPAEEPESAAEQRKEVKDQEAQQAEHDANTLVLEITCPPGVGSGESVEVETENGLVEVVIPDGVEEGDSFQVSIELGPLADAAEPGRHTVADAAEPAAVAAVVTVGATAQGAEPVATGRKKRKNRGAGGCCGAKPSV